jgi:glycosyltransferase involved in cell wall biosynthesis
MKVAFLVIDNRESHRRYELPEPYFHPAHQALLVGFQSFPELEVHVVSCVQRPVESPAKLASNIWFHALQVPKIGWLRTGYQGCIRAVRRKLHELQPDLVHGQGTERDCALSAVLSGFPNVLTVHGNMRIIAKVMQATPWSFHGITAVLERLSLPRTDGVVCITRYTQQAVAQLARKTWLIPNAVHPAFFQTQNTPVDPPTFLCVAYISPRKNQLFLLDSLEELARDFEFRVVFVGRGGEDGHYTARFLQRIESTPWAEYQGSMDRGGLIKLLQKAKALILPSIEDNCPMVILEAAAAGVPALGAAVGGIPELIQNGRTGFLFPPNDAAAFRELIRKILARETILQEAAARAQAEARGRFSPRSIAEQHIGVYNDVLTGDAFKPNSEIAFDSRQLRSSG